MVGIQSSKEGSSPSNASFGRGRRAPSGEGTQKQSKVSICKFEKLGVGIGDRSDYGIIVGDDNFAQTKLLCVIDMPLSITVIGDIAAQPEAACKAALQSKPHNNKPDRVG